MVDGQQSTKRRARQANRTTERLAQLRERNNAQLAEARERERRVDDALREFVTAGASIEAAEQAHAAKVRRLQDRIAALEERHKEAVTDDETARARAVLTIHECGRTVGELAELLSLSERAVARMLRDARTEVSVTAVRRSAEPTNPASSPTERSPSGATGADSARPALRDTQPPDRTEAVPPSTAATARPGSGDRSTTPGPPIPASEHGGLGSTPPAGDLGRPAVG